MVDHDPLDAAIADMLAAFPVTAARYAPRDTTLAYGLPDGYAKSEPRPLSVQEAVALQAATANTRILQAEAAMLGHGCIPLMNFDSVSDVDLLRGYAAWLSGMGELLLTVTHAVHDRHISRADFAQVCHALHDDAARGLEFIERMEAWVHAE